MISFWETAPSRGAICLLLTQSRYRRFDSRGFNPRGCDAAIRRITRAGGRVCTTGAWGALWSPVPSACSRGGCLGWFTSALGEGVGELPAYRRFPSENNNQVKRQRGIQAALCRGLA